MAMNKFKEDDRVKVYYKGNLEFIGTVYRTDKNYGLFIIEDGFYSCHNDSPFHPMQCRKLKWPCNHDACFYAGQRICLRDK